MVLRFSASLLVRLKRMYEIYLQMPKPIRRLEVIFCIPILHYVWGSIACDMPAGFCKLYLSKSCSRRTSTSELDLQLIKYYILLHGRGWEWAPYYHLWWTWRNLQGEIRPTIVLEGMKFTYMRWILQLTSLLSSSPLNWHSGFDIWSNYIFANMVIDILIGFFVMRLPDSRFYTRWDRRAW